MEKTITFVHAVYRNEKFFVPLRIAGKNYGDEFFFDTGSSIFPLSTTPELWRSLTGRNGEELDNVALEVPSWGNKIKLVGAPLKGSIEIESATIDRPMIPFQPSNENDFSKWPFTASGLFGNSLLSDRLVVVDVQRQRFGIPRLLPITLEKSTYRQ